MNAQALRAERKKLATLWPAYDWSKPTPRQLESVALLIRGYDISDIASIMGISHDGAEIHLYNARRRIGLPLGAHWRSILLADLYGRVSECLPS